MTASHTDFTTFEGLIDEETGSFTEGQVGLMGTTRIAIVASAAEGRAFGVNADATGWVAVASGGTEEVPAVTWTMTPSQGTETDAAISQFLEDMRAYIND
jgi:hypothetical protein